LGEVTHVRSTLVTASLQALRSRGLHATYCARLPRAHADEILTTVAGTWLPITTAHAHYQTCDALQAQEGRVLEMGMEVGDRVNGTFLGAMVRSARTAGATPWIALAQSRRLYERLFSGDITGAANRCHHQRKRNSPSQLSRHRPEYRRPSLSRPSSCHFPSWRTDL
jgi:hypothetical protein